MKIQFLLSILIAAAFAGCDTQNAPKPESTARVEMRQNEQNQQRLSTAVPAPVVKTSLERKNLKRRITEPAAGQNWDQDGKLLHMKAPRVADDYSG